MTTHTAQTKSAGVTRRDFLKTSGTAAAGAALFSTFFDVTKADALTGEHLPDPVEPAPTDTSIVYRFSVCQNCHSRCGLMCKVAGPTGSTDPAAGVLVKIDGNPFHPHNMAEDERLTNADSVAEATANPGRLCPKGQAGIQVLYDPYRIKHPLRRVGSRGSGQWEVVGWGEVLPEIAAKINALIPTGTRLTADVDPLYPTLGKAANFLAFSPGRLPDREATNKIMFSCYGTINERLDHTSICEVTHHVSNELMTAGSSSRKDHFKPDVQDCLYLMLFGANYLEANFPMLGLGRKVVDMKKRGGKLVVVDPRFSNSAAKADVWVPARPGTDGALALGMAVHILKSVCGLTTIAAGQTDGSPTARYLRNATKAAANAAPDYETTWTDASRLVIVSTAGGVPATCVPGAYLRATDVGLGLATDFVCLTLGVPTGYTSTSAVTAVHGDLLAAPAGVVIAAGGGTVTCKPAYQILYEHSIAPYSVEYYAGIAGVDPDLVRTLATDFYAAGKRAHANPYRGTVQHTNAMGSMQAVMLLNLLVGNFDWVGGTEPGAGNPSWTYTGMAGSGSYVVTGSRIDRAQVSNTAYTTLHAANPVKWPYPAKRPWMSQASHGNYQEIMPGILNQHPHPIKVLITYWNNLAYATPALKNVFLTTVMDTGKLPLFVAIDNVMGETSAYADYILPDTTYLEKWAFPGGANVSFKTKYVNFRQPVVGSYDGKAWDAPFDHSYTLDTQPIAPATWPSAVNNYSPIYPDTRMYEDILIGLMSALGLTREIGTGAGGVNNGNFLPPNGYLHVAPAINRLVTNTLSDITAGVLGFKAGITAADVIGRGGVFQDPGNGDDISGTPLGSGKLRVKWDKELRLYYPQLATDPDVMASYTLPGPVDVVVPFAPVLTAPPVARWEEVKDIKGATVIDGAWPFQLITYKSVLHGQARTQNLPWLTCWLPENFIELNPQDAEALGVRDYDKVRVSSPSSLEGVVGHVKLVEGLRPGVVAIMHHYGHWQNAATGWQEDGVNMPYDPTRAMGISPNPIMRLDPALGDVSLQCRMGGSCSFYDTRVKVEKVTT